MAIIRETAALFALLSLAACAAEPRVTALGAEGASGHAGSRLEQQDEEPDCIRFWGEARYRYPGYDHVVHVDNACLGRAYCHVWTNVDPDPIPVVVDSGETSEVIVRQGSPAREFVPQAVCKIEGSPNAE